MINLQALIFQCPTIEIRNFDEKFKCKICHVRSLSVSEIQYF